MYNLGNQPFGFHPARFSETHRVVEFEPKIRLDGEHFAFEFRTNLCPKIIYPLRIVNIHRRNRCIDSYVKQVGKL